MILGYAFVLEKRKPKAAWKLYLDDMDVTGTVYCRVNR